MSRGPAAADLLGLLEIKHRQDVCVRECKTGPTHYSRDMQKFDLWVMPCSWAKPWVSGYEIKVSRSDFVQDDKWPGYLPFCNLFSFVSPWGLIAPEEVPEGVGLYWASKNCERLYCKRKPPLRQDAEIPDSIFRYVLMSRARIHDGETFPPRGLGRKEYEKFLRSEKVSNQAIGRQFAEAIRTQVQRRVGEIKENADRQKRENDSLRYQIRQYDELIKALDEMGIEVMRYNYRSLPQRVRERFGINAQLRHNLKSLHSEISKVLEAVEEISAP